MNLYNLHPVEDLKIYCIHHINERIPVFFDQESSRLVIRSCTRCEERNLTVGEQKTMIKAKEFIAKHCPLMITGGCVS